ncbi:MAG: hypothetical protein IJX98_00430 [Clostridia bacterium]|nr:hypothetical protein [Clostridia bacterium]
MTKSMKRKMIAGLFVATMLTAGVAVGGVINASAETCAITMRAGAGVRISEGSGTGIRFTADIPVNLVNEETVEGVKEYSVKYTEGELEEVGMVIVPAFTLENYTTGNVFEYLQTNYNKTQKEVSAVCNKVYLDEDGYYVAGAIVDILDENLSYSYQAIPYTYDGTDYTFGAKSDERTIHDVFNAALEDQEMETEDRADLLNKVVEMQDKLKLEELFISNFDGYDLSNFTIADNADWEIVSAGVGSYTATPVDGKLASMALPGAATRKEEAQDFTITYANSETLTLPAKVWMKKVSTFADLQAMVSLTTDDSSIGYVGLTNDIACDINTELKMNTINSDTARYIFDGNGYTISNFYGALGHTTLMTCKDVNFINCQSPAGRGLLGIALKGNSFVENVNITTTLYKWDVSSAICNNVFAGALNMNNVNIVVLDTLTDASYTAGTRHGVIFGRVPVSSDPKYATVSLTDCTFVSANTGKTEGLPLIGAPETKETNYHGTSHIGTEAYNARISGTYKHYAYTQLGQAQLDLTDETKSTASFREFVSKNNLTSGWGPFGVTLTAVSDMEDLAAMVVLTDGYWYLTNDIVWDATKWTVDNSKEILTTGVLDGNGFAIDGMTDYLFRGFKGVCQNIAFTNIKATMGSISHRAQEGMTLNNVFFHGEIMANSGAVSGGNTSGLIAGVSSMPFTAKDVVVYTTNNIENATVYRGAVAGLTAKGSSLTGDNLVIVSKTKPVCKYLLTDTTQTLWMTEAEMEGDTVDGVYDGYLQGTYHLFDDQTAFETNYTGTLSAQNLAYYQKLINSGYGVASV